MRKNISTHTPSEDRVGYSRAVRVNHRIYISGTTAQNEQGEIMGPTLYEQTKYIFEKFKKVLKGEQFSLNDIVSLTVYATDIKKLGDFDRAFKEYFYEIKPTCTLIGISWLVKEDLFIEVEAIAEK